MSDARTLAANIVRAVAELPDRTSPDDWPEAMLVTSEELTQIVETALAAEEAPRTEPGGCPLCKATGPHTHDCGDEATR